MTLWYDNQYNQPVIATGTSDRIYLPQTGEALPLVNYLLSGIFVCFAIIAGILFRQRRRLYQPS